MKKVKKVTEIICILDRSGSMMSMRDEAISGFNHFIEEQKELPGKAIISTYLFDYEYLALYEMKKLKKALKLNRDNFVPRGSTALLDAIGITINNFNSRKEDDRKDKTLFVILTDGLENASQEYKDPNVINNLINEQRKKNCEFMFLGAGQDAIATASSVGIPTTNSMSVNSTKAGMQHAYAKMSGATARYRSASGSNVDNLISDEEREEAKSK